MIGTFYSTILFFSWFAPLTYYLASELCEKREREWKAKELVGGPPDEQDGDLS